MFKDIDLEWPIMRNENLNQKNKNDEYIEVDEPLRTDKMLSEHGLSGLSMLEIRPEFDLPNKYKSDFIKPKMGKRYRIFGSVNKNGKKNKIAVPKKQYKKNWKGIF